MISLQIKSLKIDNHKCLLDFNINLAINDSGSSTIFIGENGTGKTTTLEAILKIFMSFDSDAVEKQIDFNYEIEYYFGGEFICITQSGKNYKIDINHENLCVGRMQTVRKHLAEKNIFPQRVITFYSGANDKFKSMVKQINNNYAKDCRKVINEFQRVMSDDTSTIIPSLRKRKFNYCDEALTPIYLCSILGGNNTFEKTYLKEKCSFDGISYIDMIVNVDKVEYLFGRKRFQGDIPTGLYYLSDYLDHRFTNLLRRGFMYSSIGKSYFEIKGIEGLGVDTISILEFFEKLHTLFDAQFEVVVSKGEDSVRCSDMSEGQRQLIKMLGMLGVCKKEDCLVLMDEPDAHMNPMWKYDIKNTIDESLKSATNAQALISTHDPLVINGVDKEYIRIFTYNEALKKENGYYATKVIEPTENTQGMGVDGLLQSEYYGLSSVLDTETKEKMSNKLNLLIKKKEGALTEEESEQLEKLTEELENMVFARNIPIDSYYDEYVAAMHKIYKERPQATLTAADISERNAKAEEILRGLLNK